MGGAPGGIRTHATNVRDRGPRGAHPSPPGRLAHERAGLDWSGREWSRDHAFVLTYRVETRQGLAELDNFGYSVLPTGKDPPSILPMPGAEGEPAAEVSDRLEGSTSSRAYPIRRLKKRMNCVVPFSPTTGAAVTSSNPRRPCSSI